MATNLWIRGFHLRDFFISFEGAVAGEMYRVVHKRRSWGHMLYVDRAVFLYDFNVIGVYICTVASLNVSNTTFRFIRVYIRVDVFLFNSLTTDDGNA